MAEPADIHAALEFGTLTTVQLPAGVAKRRGFLANLQSSVAASMKANSLVLGNGDDVFVIPKPLESLLRSNPTLNSSSSWVSHLKQCGALTANEVSAVSALALIARGKLLGPSQPQTVKKVSLATSAPITQPIEKSLPTQFQGPFDWHLGPTGCDVVRAWQLFASDPKFRTALPWDNVKIGHIDTGYSEHSALAWSYGSSTTVLPALGHDYLENDGDPRDLFVAGSPGHGTRISGTASGFYPIATGNPYYGVAPGAKIVPYRVTTSVFIEDVKGLVAEAIISAVDGGCHVINISLGALFGAKVIAAALDYAYMHGVIVVCAAGNVWEEVIYPGRYNRCITMGGVCEGDIPWSGSARGRYVDLCAPADSMRRAKAEDLPPGQAATQMEPKSDGDGTSYSTAICSGVATLWLAFHGVDALRAKYGPELWQIPRAFKQLLRASARKPANWDSGQYGSGIIGAADLLSIALPSTGSMTLPKSANDVFDPTD